jgi:hypothetical protein
LGPGAIERRNSLCLHLGEPADFGLELQRVAAALVDGDDVRDAGARTEPLEDGRLGDAALATIRSAASFVGVTGKFVMGTLGTRGGHDWRSIGGCNAGC